MRLRQPALRGQHVAQIAHRAGKARIGDQCVTIGLFGGVEAMREQMVVTGQQQCLRGGVGGRGREAGAKHAGFGAQADIAQGRRQRG